MTGTLSEVVTSIQVLHAGAEIIAESFDGSETRCVDLVCQTIIKEV